VSLTKRSGGKFNIVHSRAQKARKFSVRREMNYLTLL